MFCKLAELHKFTASAIRAPHKAVIALLLVMIELEKSQPHRAIMMRDMTSGKHARHVAICAVLLVFITISEAYTFAASFLVEHPFLGPLASINLLKRMRAHDGQVVYAH